MSLPPLPHCVDAFVANSRKRGLSDRPAESDTSATQRLSCDCGDCAAGTPLTARLASLAVVHSQAPLTTRPETSCAVCPASSPAPEQARAHLFKKALTALATGGLCSPVQLATLKREYGSLKELMPYLGPTFVGVEGLSLSYDEWNTVVRQYPLALSKVPCKLLNDALCVAALCASKGSARVVRLLPKGHEERLCRRAFDEDSDLIGLLPVCERTPERCRAACRSEPQALVHVPEAIRTEQFLQQVCDRNTDCFRELPDHQKTKSLAMQVCKQKGELLEDVPIDLRDEDLCKTACLASALAIAAVPYERFTAPFCQLLVDRCHMALRHIPPQKITADMCWKSCRRWPEAIQFVPDDLKTEPLYNMLVQRPNCYLAYPYIPLRFISEQKCKELCELSAGHLEYVPDVFKNAKLYRSVTRQDLWSLHDIAERHRTVALCLKSGIDHPSNLSAVPDLHINLAFLFRVMSKKDDLALHTRVQKLLPDKDYTTFLCISALYRSQTQLKLLTWPALPDHFRERLINFLAGTDTTIALHHLPKQSLINEHSPLRFELHNPLVSKLLLQAHTARHYRPACQADGQAWLRYLKAQLRSHLKKPLPLIDCALAKPLQTGDIKATGGRTLQVQDGDTIYYYKFQRKGELLKDLLREGLIHQFRAEHKDGAWGKLASDLPTDPHFFALPEGMWPKQIKDFKDSVEKNKEGEREWLNVYRYTASADYGRYAHELDRAANCPFKKPEDAILTACYDMGLFASMGLMLTSMLPAFHNSYTGRSWQTLYDLFGYRHAGEVHPGTLGAWNGTATRFCDIGFNGLRDVGDYEQFGLIESCFAKSDNDGSAQPVQTGQRLAVASTLCDNVMAALLIRSRLRQQDCDYHYKSDQTVDETAHFIGAVCDHLLTGLAGRGIKEVQPGTTRTTMALSPQGYRAWLRRAASEMVYWTARQPDLRCGKIDTLEKVSYDPMDGWASHLQKRHNLSAILYDPADFRPSANTRCYPDNFRNLDEEENLGAGSKVFPFTTLVQGLTSLAGDILAHPYRLAAPEAEDTAMQST